MTRIIGRHLTLPLLLIASLLSTVPASAQVKNATVKINGMI